MKIAVSACLLGRNCRYDGKSKPCETVLSLSEHHELVPICPEVAGGMSIPHLPSEIASMTPIRVVDCEGQDHTAKFVSGAERTLQRILDKGCEAVILKAKSPSCGIGRVYDGTFTRTLIDGNGVAANMIIAAGIPVYDEHHIPASFFD